MRSRRRAVLYVVCLVLCAELGSRFLLLTPWIRARLPPTLDVTWRARWVGRYLFDGRPMFYAYDVYDPTKGWALRAGLRGFRQSPESTVSSNSRGIRGSAEHEEGRRHGRRRIVALGDSFTFGQGVDDEQTYPQRLQELLGGGVEVINLGVHGYGHDQMLIRLREEGLRYSPDLVVLGFFPDDAERNRLGFRDYGKPRFVLRDGALTLTGSPVPPPSRMLWGEALRFHFLDLAGIVRQRWRGAEAGRQDRDTLMAALLDEMRRVAEGAGARFAIVDLPPPAEIARAEEVAPTERLVLGYAESRGIPVCLTRRALAAASSEPAHPGAKRHYTAGEYEVVARTLARCISEGGQLPPARAPTAP